MNEQKSTRKETVKTIAIIFLAILLVLTFFSNTIMNYSLTEVNASYTHQATITEQIRGSGTIEAEEKYTVSVSESREVKSVLVKAGDTVNAGDVLFELTGEESSELENAKETLDELQLAYDKALISYNAGSSYTSELNAIADAESELEKLQALYDEAINGTDDISELTTEYKSAKKQVETITAQISELETMLAALDTDDMLDLSEKYYNQIIAAENAVETAQDAYDKAKTKYDSVVSENATGDYSDDITAKRKEIELSQNLINQYYNQIAAATADDDISSIESELAEEQINLKYLQQELSTLISKSSKSSSSQATIDAYGNVLNKKEEALTTAQSNLTALIRSIKLEIKAEITKLTEQLNDANDKLEEITESKTNAEENSVDANDIAEQIAKQEIIIRDLKAELSEQQANDNVTEQTAYLDLQNLKKQLDAQQEKVDALLENQMGSTITAQVGGIIESISITAGETISAGETAMVITLVDKGYTVSFSVGITEAQKLTVGEKAEITSWYWGDGMEATLVAISPDTSSPQTSRILKFSITGDDITEGQTISLAMGSKGQSYSTCVSNSAIREDANGKFVLVVESQSTALGNRYKAVRYDVEIVAKDDNNSAVSGLTGSEFVITTSTKPIESGEQVRLAN